MLKQESRSRHFSGVDEDPLKGLTLLPSTQPSRMMGEGFTLQLPGYLLTYFIEAVCRALQAPHRCVPMPTVLQSAVRVP